VTDESPIQPRLAWISALGIEDIPTFAKEVAEGFWLALETHNPEPLRRTLYAWRSTADYAMSGPHRELEKPDWDVVVRITRPADEE
jgi:hypothetical protein